MSETKDQSVPIKLVVADDHAVLLESLLFRGMFDLGREPVPTS